MWIYRHSNNRGLKAFQDERKLQVFFTQTLNSKNREGEGKRKRRKSCQTLRIWRSQRPGSCKLSDNVLWVGNCRRNLKPNLLFRHFQSLSSNGILNCQCTIWKVEIQLLKYTPICVRIWQLELFVWHLEVFKTRTFVKQLETNAFQTNFKTPSFLQLVIPWKKSSKKVAGRGAIPEQFSTKNSKLPLQISWCTVCVVCKYRDELINVI